ncbi:MAG TPA: hypothetical protein GXX36_07325 [Clostridiaceae bacterium]|nr:hypothetical protein [Clostridiaceae bacterium]
MVETLAENDNNINVYLLINASNQANLTNISNMSAAQANVVFVLVNPYYIDNFNLENMNLNISMNEHNKVIINDKEFDTIEMQPGIRVFGVIESIKE